MSFAFNFDICKLKWQLNSICGSKELPIHVGKKGEKEDRMPIRCVTVENTTGNHRLFYKRTLDRVTNTK